MMNLQNKKIVSKSEAKWTTMNRMKTNLVKMMRRVSMMKSQTKLSTLLTKMSLTSMRSPIKRESHLLI